MIFEYYQLFPKAHLKLDDVFGEYIKPRQVLETDKVSKPDPFLTIQLPARQNVSTIHNKPTHKDILDDFVEALNKQQLGIGSWVPFLDEVVYVVRQRVFVAGNSVNEQIQIGEIDINPNNPSVMNYKLVVAGYDSKKDEVRITRPITGHGFVVSLYDRTRVRTPHGAEAELAVLTYREEVKGQMSSPEWDVKNTVKNGMLIVQAQMYAPAPTTQPPTPEPSPGEPDDQ